MNDQQVKGSLVKGRGRIEAFLGRLTGNRRQQAKGVVHQAEGNVRHGIGDVQQAVERPAGQDPTKADATKS
jgi:uncharacterized protein YjbJ (UPF0337 family)